MGVECRVLKLNTLAVLDFVVLNNVQPECTGISSEKKVFKNSL